MFEPNILLNKLKDINKIFADYGNLDIRIIVPLEASKTQRSSARRRHFDQFRRNAQ